MASPASDFIDLIASGDESKIKCVLMPTLGGAAAGGILFSETGPGAAVAAVLGGFGAYLAAYRMCGAASTRGSFEGMFSGTGMPKAAVEAYEQDLMRKYGVDAQQARYVSKAAAVYLQSGGSTRAAPASSIEARNGVHLLLRNAGMLA
jgi:hypothetical protein